MTSQIRPLSGGAWNNITHSNKVAAKTTTLGVTVSAAKMALVCQAMNTWLICAGTGQGAIRAQKIAAAVGLQLQEV